MQTDKDKILQLLAAQSDGASYDEIVRNLVFERMLERGLADSRNGRVISDEEMKRRFL